MWATVIEVILGLFRKAPERIEPVIRGYDTLVNQLQEEVSALRELCKSLYSEVQDLKGKFAACESRHAERDKKDFERETKILHLEAQVASCKVEHINNATAIVEVQEQLRSTSQVQ